MPTKRVRESDRKRCAQACENCKQRKQRCDGLRPCRRCTRRGLARDCQSSSSSSSLSTRYPLLASSLPSPDPDHFRKGTPPDGAETGELSPGVLRADGTIMSQPTPHMPPRSVSDTLVNTEASPSSISSSSQLLSRGFPARVPQMSRLVKDTKGQYMFIGDSATLSFLQNIRRIVRKSLGSCPFVDDPLRHLIVESSPDTPRGWIVSSAQNPPPRPSEADVDYLQRWYMQSADGVLLLFRGDELATKIRAWRERDSDEADPASPVYYLVLAIGAQTGPEDKDELAETLFNYARFLTVESLMEDPDMTTIQAFALITMYLLGASRRNSAFMYLGMGVRAAYALGLHRKDISALFPPAECRARERLWKAVRILDLFMSASLGRPPSTSETRETCSREEYSACNDLSMIFESVLSQIYAKRMISTEVIERISQHHRRWSAQSRHGFETDGILPGELLDDAEGKRQPNMGLLNLKQTAFWTIILLSFPFLLKEVAAHVDASPSLANKDKANQDNSNQDAHQDVRSSSNQVLVYACLEAAIHNVDMLQAIFAAEHVPKRLPFVINSVFISGLVLGVAAFGDFDGTFPLERSLRLALSTLGRFAARDAVARRHLVILEHLQGAVDRYTEVRARWKMERQSHLVGGLFGSIHSIGVPGSEQQQQQTSQTSDDQQPGEPLVAPSPAAIQPVLDVAGVDMAAPFSDLIPAISPSFLWFDAFGETVPLYPTVDAGMVDMEGDVMRPVGYNEFIM